MNASERQVVRERFASMDTPAVSDAMDGIGLSGALRGITPRIPGKMVAGPAFTVRYGPLQREPGEFHGAGNYIDDVEPGCVIFIDNQGRSDCTNWGGILSEVARLRGVAATVVHGAARDLAEIRGMGYPLFSSAIHMVSGKNRVRVTGVQVDVEVDGVSVRPGDWIVADDNGALAIPQARVLEVLERAERVDRTERRIREAVLAGTPLVQARKRFRYDQPWLDTSS